MRIADPSIDPAKRRTRLWAVVGLVALVVAIGFLVRVDPGGVREDVPASEVHERVTSGESPADGPPALDAVGEFGLRSDQQSASSARNVLQVTIAAPRRASGGTDDSARCRLSVERRFSGTSTHEFLDVKVPSTSDIALDGTEESVTLEASSDWALPSNAVVVTPPFGAVSIELCPLGSLEVDVQGFGATKAALFVMRLPDEPTEEAKAAGRWLVLDEAQVITFDGLVPGRYRVELGALPDGNSTDTRTKHIVEVGVIGGETATTRLPLRGGECVVSGRVTINGAGAAGVQVRGFCADTNSRDSTTTGQDGDYRLTFIGVGVASIGIDGVVGGLALPRAGQSVEIVGDQVSLDFDLRLTEVQGRLVAATDAVVLPGSVWLESLGRSRSSGIDLDAPQRVQVGDDGKFRFLAAAGIDYRIRTLISHSRDAGMARHPMGSMQFSISSNAPLVLEDLVLGEPFPVSGRVVWSDGRDDSTKGAMVYARPLEQYGAKEYIARTSSDGSWSAWLPFGVYEMGAASHQSGRGATSAAPLVVEVAGEYRIPDLVLEDVHPGALLEWIDPSTGAALRFTFELEAVPGSILGASGPWDEFKLQHQTGDLPAGQYRAKLRSSSGGTATRDFELGPSKHLVSIRVICRPEM